KALEEAETRRKQAEEEARKAAEEAAIMAQLKAEEEERQVTLLAEQKAARDARYAARKAAKKERRRGYKVGLSPEGRSPAPPYTLDYPSGTAGASGHGSASRYPVKIDFSASRSAM